MQDRRDNSIGALNGSRKFGGWIATLQGAKNQLGHVASRRLSGGPVRVLVIVCIVSIFLIRGSG